MKITSIIVCSFLLTGCLRYRYDVALKSVPDCAKIIDVNNDFITYVYQTNTYKIYYDTDGRIHKTEKIN
jgi:hypothetical protein